MPLIPQYEAAADRAAGAGAQAAQDDTAADGRARPELEPPGVRA